jgi:acetyl-CoA carboxylase biotin carboxyl carrier protein
MYLQNRNILFYSRNFYFRLHKQYTIMDLKQVQELVKLVTKSGIAELKVKEGDFSITIKSVSNGTPMVQMPYQQVAPQALAETAKKEEAVVAVAATAAPANDNVFTFRSPMIGTFYRKPGADKEPFVKVGDSIKNGDVLCIVEAMKLFNEIEFDGGAGKIVKILVDDASPVEYDQPLFLIEKA